MPELPEVEHARVSLSGWLLGATIARIDVLDGRMLDEGVTAARVARALGGRRVTAIDRRGKWLRLGLDRGLCFSHLGMTGKWVAPGGAGLEASTRIAIEAEIGGASRLVAYVDPRLFGRFVTADADLPEWSSLGPDPLVDGIDPARLHAALTRRRGSVKATLLDQSLLAGIGNIQAIEGLFFAGIDPRRAPASLSREETAALAAGLLRSIHATLASQAGGLTYLSEGGDNPFAIYGRQGAPCPMCETPLRAVVLAGRGTVLCDRCQA